MVLVGPWKTGVRKLWPATQLLMSRKHCAKLEPCCHMCAWGSGMALMLLEGFQTMFKRCFWIPLSFPVLCLVKGINILVLLPLFCHMLGILWFFVSPFFLYLTCFLSVTGLRQVIFLLIFYCFIGQLNKFQYFKINNRNKKLWDSTPTPFSVIIHWKRLDCSCLVPGTCQADQEVDRSAISPVHIHG